MQQGVAELHGRNDRQPSFDDRPDDVRDVATAGPFVHACSERCLISNPGAEKWAGISEEARQNRRDPASHGGAIFSAVPKYLIALGQSGQGIRHRHLAALVAFESHLLQDLATGQAVTLPDQLEQSLPPAAAARSRLPACRRLPRCLAGLRRLISLDSRVFTVYCIELALQLLLLTENLLALDAEPIPLSGNILGKIALLKVTGVINVGHRCSPLRHKQSM